MGDGERLLRCFRESSTGILQLAEIEEREVCVYMFVYFAHACLCAFCACMFVCILRMHVYFVCMEGWEPHPIVCSSIFFRRWSMVEFWDVE